jgi:hypothetical protein
LFNSLLSKRLSQVTAALLKNSRRLIIQTTRLVW